MQANQVKNSCSPSFLDSLRRRDDKELPSLVMYLSVQRGTLEMRRSGQELSDRRQVGQMDGIGAFGDAIPCSYVRNHYGPARPSLHSAPLAAAVAHPTTDRTDKETRISAWRGAERPCV